MLTLGSTCSCFYGRYVEDFINNIAVKMNLKERMQHQNRNNSSILNNSNFDFAKGNREDQVYEKSRRECEEELYKRKSQLEQEKHGMVKTKEREVNYALEKFNSDFEDIRKQIITQINTSLSDMKARYASEIRQRCMIEANQEIKLRTSVDEFLATINNHLSGLKKDQYREEIARIVVKDFDTAQQDLKNAIKRLKYILPYTTIDQKHYTALRNDVVKTIKVDFGHRREEEKNRESQPQKSPPPRQMSAPYPPQQHAQGDVNLHENRDRLKKSYH